MKTSIDMHASLLGGCAQHVAWVVDWWGESRNPIRSPRMLGKRGNERVGMQSDAERVRNIPNGIESRWPAYKPFAASCVITHSYNYLRYDLKVFVVRYDFKNNCSVRHHIKGQNNSKEQRLKTCCWWMRMDYFHCVEYLNCSPKVLLFDILNP